MDAFYSRADPVQTLYLSVGESFDETFQQTCIELRFDPDLCGEYDVDVSCLLSGGPATTLDGVLYTSGGPARYARSKDAKDQWPGFGDCFWSWSKLAKIFKRRGPYGSHVAYGG